VRGVDVGRERVQHPRKQGIVGEEGCQGSGVHPALREHAVLCVGVGVGGWVREKFALAYLCVRLYARKIHTVLNHGCSATECAA